MLRHSLFSGIADLSSCDCVDPLSPGTLLVTKSTTVAPIVSDCPSLAFDAQSLLTWQFAAVCCNRTVHGSVSSFGVVTAEAERLPESIGHDSGLIFTALVSVCAMDSELANTEPTSTFFSPLWAAAAIADWIRVVDLLRDASYDVSGAHGGYGTPEPFSDEPVLITLNPLLSTSASCRQCLGNFARFAQQQQVNALDHESTLQWFPGPVLRMLAHSVGDQLNDCYPGFTSDSLVLFVLCIVNSVVYGPDAL